MRPDGNRGLRTGWTGEDRLRRHEEKVLLLLTLVIGALVGLVVVAFILLTENLGARLYPAGASGWRRLLVPLAGALVSGILLYRYFPDARGSGIPQTKTAMYLRDGYISLRTVLGKFGCSALSLASGIALGREGPSVQIGAGLASVIGRRLGLRPFQVKRLVPVGASAALAAAFNTPIAAVLFSLEEVMGDLHAPVLGSVVLASATSWMVLHLLLGDEPLFHVPAYQLVHPVEFAVYAVLGVVGGIVSLAFVRLLLAVRARFLALPAPTAWFQPAVGGLAIGLMGWFVPDVLGVGYGHVGDALNGKVAFASMGLLLGLKLVATATAYGTGNAGGIFGPSLFLGAMLGGVVGSAAHTLLPDYTGGVGAYALVGMGAAFAGIIRVPMTSVIMIFEITRDYTIIVPLMIANLISYFISARWQPEPIYEALLRQDRISLPSPRESRDERLTVSLAMRPIAAPAAADQPGGDGANRLVPSGPQMETATIQPGCEVYPDDLLETALKRLAAARVTTVPVVGRDDMRTLLGTVSVDDILEAFRAEAVDSAAPEAASTSPRRLLAGVASAIVALLLLVGGLGYYYREARLAKGHEALIAGRKLLEQGRVPEAVQDFRAALAATGSSDARLALAEALLTGGHASEAAVYFREVLRGDATSGAANLGLARASAEAGSTEDAVLYYGRAIVGTWPRDEARRRIDARFELADLLAGSGARNQAIAQLLELEREAPRDAVTRRRIGRQFLALSAPEQAAEVFRDLVKANPRDAAAYAGLGEADFARAEYGAALASYRTAAMLDPSDAAVAGQRALCEQAVALDPSRRGLRVAERHARSLKLVEGALARLEVCAVEQAGRATEPARLALADEARRILATKRRPASYSEAADSNVQLAGQLWKAGQSACVQPDDARNPAGLVLARLARD